MDWLGFFVPRLGWRRQPLESLAAPHAEDVERLGELRERGSKLRLPHPVRAFLVFDREGGAREASEFLQKEGYNCTLRAAPDGTWVATAIMHLVPTPGALTKLREQMQAASAMHGGAYRGWDAPVIY